MHSDVQSLGQLIVLLIKHTDLGQPVKPCVSEKLSDLVQSCSFKFKTWEEVLTHDFLNQEIELVMPNSQEEEKSESEIIPVEGQQYDDLNAMMPLKESAIIEEEIPRDQAQI